MATKKHHLRLCINSVVDSEAGFRDYRFVAKKAADNLGFEVFRYPEDLSNDQRKYNEVLRKSDPVVLVLIGKRDSAAVRRECQIALKNCLPIMLFVKKEGSRVSKDARRFAAEISPMAFDGECVAFSNCEELDRLVTSRLEDYLAARYKTHTMLEAYIGQAYSYSVNMFEKAKNQVILFQNTSSLILGPKNDNDIEATFQENFFNWLRLRTEEMSFIHIFSRPSTLEALTCDDYDIGTAKAALEGLVYAGVAKDKHFSVRCIDEPISTSFFICDREVFLIFPVAGERYTIIVPSEVSSFAEINKIASQLSTVGRSVSDLLALYDGSGF